LENFFSTN
jgi:hypothetical protein